MPEDKNNGKGDASPAASPESKAKTTIMSLGYRPNAASKKILKKYRTEVAASSASLLSTFITVRLLAPNTKIEAD